MIKGCTKRMVVVKDLCSDIFEEAYFILRPTDGKKTQSHKHTDIVTEANRIVSESKSIGFSPMSVGAVKPEKQGRKMRDLIFFGLGFFVAAAVYGFYFALL